VLISLIIAVLVLLRNKFRQQQRPHPAPEIGQGVVGGKSDPIEISREHDTSGEVPSGALGEDRITSQPIRYLVDDSYPFNPPD
jgi:hypothetical protein